MPFPAGPLLTKGVADRILLTTQTAVTATLAATTAVDCPRPPNFMGFELDVTSAATAAGDTLAVFIQTSYDGTNFLDVVAFTAVLGNGGAKRFYAKITAAQAETMFENASALAASSVRNHLGDTWRVRYVIVNNTTPIFTFTVTAMPG